MTKPPDAADLPHHYQETDYTCGPAAMRMVLEGLLGVHATEPQVAQELGATPDVGTRQRLLLSYAQRHGLDSFERHTDTRMEDLRDLVRDGHVVAVCYWIPEEGIDHYSLVTSIGSREIVLHDPWFGPGTRLPLATFEANWRSDPAISTRRDRWLLAITVPQPPPP